MLNDLVREKREKREKATYRVNGVYRVGVKGMAEPSRPLITIELRPEPDCTNYILAIRRLLKLALRTCRLRCVKVDLQSSRDIG